MHLLLLGYGRMGKLVDQLSESYGCEVTGRLDIDTNPRGAGITAEQVVGVDVAIDFSTADAVIDNLPRLADLGVNLVVGTTGWQANEDAMRQIAAAASIGVVAAANFSLGVNLFLALTERAAELFEPRPEFGAWIHEIHHAAKIDAPSGTALALQNKMQQRGYSSQIDMASTRAGSASGRRAAVRSRNSTAISLARSVVETHRWQPAKTVTKAWKSSKPPISHSPNDAR